MQPSPFRPEVQDFIRATETILAHTLLNPPLTRDECDAIAQYAMALSHYKHPWSTALSSRYA
jgi:hypothetical protein